MSLTQQVHNPLRVSPGPIEPSTRRPEVQLALATVAFAVAFSVWGLLSGLMPLLKEQYLLSSTAASLIVAIPVVLGALGRVPAGILTDRLGGRLLFPALLGLVSVPCFALALDHSYSALVFWGFWLGIAGASFAIGVSFVSRWFPPERQGMALGIYGAGNIGQSVAVFSSPLLAAAIGVPSTFVLFGLLSLSWAALFAWLARNAEVARRPAPFSESLRLLLAEPMAWVLSLFYFLTFGGFVALGVYLPTLLRETFDLAPADAGARTAGFVIMATLARPIGGWLSDRLTGQRVLMVVFWGLAAFAWLMTSNSIYLFTLGALGSAILLGLGNGAVFKLVPQYFPAHTGTATGLVGAAGGIGGFFPPIVLGVFQDTLHSYAPGFALLSAFALGCQVLLLRLVLERTYSLPR